MNALKKPIQFKEKKMKVIKYNKVYEVSEKEIEKAIVVRTEMLEMNKNGHYTGLVAGEALSKQDILNEIERLEQVIKELKERDNDTIATIFIWTKEDSELVKKLRKESGLADLFEDDEDDEEEVFSEPIE